MRINLIGAAGGVGTTTLAVCLAQHLGGTVWDRHDTGDLWSVSGLARPDDPPRPHRLTLGDEAHHVFDGGVRSPVRDGLVNVAVVPCRYVALRHLARGELDGINAIIPVTTPADCLTVADLESVAPVKTTAPWPMDPAIARCVDAGLLNTRLARAGRTVIDRIADQLQEAFPA